MGWWGSLRDLSKNILKQGWVKAKLSVGGGGLKVSPPLPPGKFYSYTFIAHMKLIEDKQHTSPQQVFLKSDHAILIQQ